MSHALFVTFTLSYPYSFLPCWPKTCLRGRRRQQRRRTDSADAYRYLDARTNRDIPPSHSRVVVCKKTRSETQQMQRGSREEQGREEEMVEFGRQRRRSGARPSILGDSKVRVELRVPPPRSAVVLNHHLSGKPPLTRRPPHRNILLG